MSLLEKLEETIQFIREKSPLKPQIGITLGSGLGSFVKEIQVEAEFPYGTLPHFIQTSIAGHDGRLILGTLSGIPLAVLQGRIHYYEGHSMDQVVYPTRTLSMLGIDTLVLTNSAGGLNPTMDPGDFMILEDHINLMGDNPLKGPNLQQLGPRFPDMSQPYDHTLIEKLEQAMKKNSIKYHRGVYCGVSGPTYETPSEVRHLKMVGGHAVGMSTIPESIAANHLGLRVCGVSCITNLAAGLSKKKLSHDEVTNTAKNVEHEFCLFLSDFIKSLPLSTKT